MNSYRTLTGLFLKQLIRRKSIWLVCAVFMVMLTINVFINAQFKEYLDQGATFDVATKKAAKQLESYAGQIKGYGLMIVVMVSALIAPGSRKDGTTQFLISLSVSRFRLAVSQLTALIIFVFVSTLLIHVGYLIPALKLGIVSIPEILFAWLYLLIPLLLVSLIVFSMSLSRSAIMTYAIFLLIPFLLIPLMESSLISLADKTDMIPFFLSRCVDNLEFLYPPIHTIIFWPHLTLGPPVTEPPFPNWTWTVVHLMTSIAFWLTLSAWLYRRYNFGTRVLTK